MPSFESKPLRPQMPDSIHDVRGVAIGRIRINNPLEHDGVLIEWQFYVPTQRIASS